MTGYGPIDDETMAGRVPHKDGNLLWFATYRKQVKQLP